MDDTHIAKFLEIAAAVIPVLWLAVAIELRTADFLKSGKLGADPSRQRAWAMGIALLMVASGIADMFAFAGLLGTSTPAQAGFVAVVLYLLIGLVILLSLHRVFPDNWDELLSEGGDLLTLILILLAWPVVVPAAVWGAPEPAAAPAVDHG